MGTEPSNDLHPFYTFFKEKLHHKFDAERPVSVFKPACFKDSDCRVVVSEEKRTIYIVNEAFTKVIAKRKFNNVTGRKRMRI